MIYDYQEEKVSVIVPVYHMEQFLPICLRSLVDQIHSNIEIIVVDDGSGRDAGEICESFGDERIRYIRKEKNEGLFRARVTGVEAAGGSYVAFVDADDSVSIDFIRMLLNKAKEADADVAMGGTVIVAEDGTKSVISLQESVLQFGELTGDELRKIYFEQSGCCPSWQNIWNKLYSKDLFDSCMPWFEKVDRRIVMGEDIAFSSVLLYNAKKLAMEPEAIYFYYEHSSSSTGNALATIVGLTGNLLDMTFVFDFVEGYLAEQHAPQSILDNFSLFRKRYGVVWKELRENIGDCGDENSERAFDKALADYCGEIPADLTSGTYFGLFKHPWGEGMEVIKKTIVEGPYKYVSFDVFDTLITRPFDDPKRMFRLLDKKFEAIYPATISFHTIREEGEQGARMEASIQHPEWEDITLAEIYEYIGRTYQIPKAVCDAMLAEEEEQEIRHSAPRAAIRDLYEVAAVCGKKILLITDMYLSSKTVAAILEKNGYTGYTQIFVSAEERALKVTGHLYDTVRQKLGIRLGQLLHIGDNKNSDIEVAIEKHIDAFFVPRPLVLFENKEIRFPTGNRACMTQMASGALIDFRKGMNSVGYRSMTAMAAKKFFMNPFTIYSEGTNFGSNPYLLGYYAVGMHMAGVLKWLVQQIKRKGSNKIYFTARDGWLVMHGYQEYRKYHPELPEAEYLYVSRKAVLPAMIQTKADFFDLPIEVDQYCPAMFLRLMKFCQKEMTKEQETKLIAATPIPMDQYFQNKWEYQQFVTYYLSFFYDEKVHQKSLQTAKAYFSRIKEGALVYDMGYSGRIQAAINRLAGHRVDAVFIHSDPERYADNTRREKFEIDCFYDFSPMLPDLIREHLLSDCGPACIGYRMENGQAEPLFEEDTKNYEDRYVVESVQRGATQFLNDLYTAFEGDLDAIPFHPLEVSLPFEGFLTASTPADRAIFRRSYFEDEVYSGKIANNIENYMNEQFEYVMPAIKNLPAENY